MLDGLSSTDIAKAAIRPPGSGIDPFRAAPPSGKDAAAMPDAPKAAPKPAAKPEVSRETVYEAIMRRILASPDGRITTTKAVFEAALRSAPPEQAIELEHMASNLEIYIEDR